MTSMMTETTDIDWVKQLEDGTLPARFIVTEDLLVKLGVPPSLTAHTLTALSKRDFTTWGMLLSLETEEEMIVEVEGQNEAGRTLFRALQDFREREEANWRRRIAQLHNGPLPAFKQPPELTWGHPNGPAFVEPPEFKECLNLITNLILKCPTSNSWLVVTPAIYGPVGVGKTRFAQQLMMRASELTANERKTIRLYVSLDTMKIPHYDAFPRVHVLAFVLEYALVSRFTNLAAISWEAVRDRAERYLGRGTVVLLHVDDVEQNPGLKDIIYKACVTTMVQPAAGLVVIPIFTGSLSTPNSSFYANIPWEKEFHLHAMKGGEFDKLENSFRESLQIEKDLYDGERLLHLRRLFEMCGGLPGLVDSLRSIIQKGDGFETNWSDVKRGILSYEQALNILDLIMADCRKLFGRSPWQALLRDKYSSLVPRETRLSFIIDIKKLLLKRLLEDISSERKIDCDAVVMDPACIPPGLGQQREVASKLTYKDIQRTGMLDIVDNVLCAPLIVVLVMERIVAGDTGLDNLFNSDSQGESEPE